MNKNILLMADVVSNEKGVDKDTIFNALEAALASATKERYGDESDVRVAIDRDTGDYESFRRWTVLEDDSEDFEFPERQIKLTYAQKDYPNIQPGTWDYLPYNWDAVAGFIRYMPENSVRYQVDESTVLQDNRIMAWKTPSGKLVIALTSRNANNFTFNVNLGGSRTMAGYEFNGTLNTVSLASQTGSTLSATLSPYTIQFWVEQ